MRISDWSSDVCSSDLLRAATSPWLRHGEDQFVALRPRFGAGKPCAMLPSRTRTEIVNIHASCVAAGNGGVLILGNSGQGKSDLALRLIDRGARLVADDRCDIWFERGRLWCRPPENLPGKLAVRGIGILERQVPAPVPPPPPVAP